MHMKVYSENNDENITCWSVGYQNCNAGRVSDDKV